MAALQKEKIFLILDIDGNVCSFSEEAYRFFSLFFSFKLQEGITISDFNFLPVNDYFFAFLREKESSHSITLSSGKTLQINFTFLVESENQRKIICEIEEVFFNDSRGALINKLSLVALNTPNAVMICDSEGDIEWVNQGFTALTGFSGEEVIGKAPFELLYDKRANQEIRTRLTEQVERGENIKETFLNYTPSGKPYWIQLIVSPVKDEAGKILNFVAIGTDVSEKMLRMDDLNDRNLLFDSISKSLPILLCVYNLEKYQLEYINQRAFNLTGYTEDEIKKLSAEELTRLVEKDDVSVLKESISRLFQHGENQSENCEITITAKNGQKKIISATHSIFRTDPEGRPTHILGSVFDITEKRKSEKYKESVSKLQELQNKKLQRIRSLTLLQGQEEERKRLSRELHDGIGQLLTAIRFKLNSMDEMVPAADDYRNNITFLRELVTKTIHEVRSVSYALVPIDLFDFGLNAALLQLCDSAQKTGLSTRFQSNLDKKRLNSTIEIELYRIAQEAINNSVKYSQASSLDVQIAFSETKGMIKLMILDNGVGFDFDPNYIYKKNTSRSYGLRNMHERSRIINGKLTIISEKNQGCIIMVEAPLKVSEI